MEASEDQHPSIQLFVYQKRVLRDVFELVVEKYVPQEVKSDCLPDSKQQDTFMKGMDFKGSGQRLPSQHSSSAYGSHVAH